MFRINDKSRPALVCFILASVTLALYWRTLGYPFVFIDDFLYVGGNPHVTAGLTWAGVVWAFHSMVAGNWHPLTVLSHMLVYQIWGLNPGAHHFVNAIFHAANACLLFLWLRRFTGAFWKSALVAALFAWHPLRVESVAWVSERKDVLSTFFWLLTLLAYACYLRYSKIKNQKSKI